MAKARRTKTKKPATHPYRKDALHTTKPSKSHSKPKLAQLQQNQKPTIPFEPTNRILLIGEGRHSLSHLPNSILTALGDFSFAASLVTQHACTSVTATTFEAPSTLLGKHPQAAAHIKTLQSFSQTVLYNIDATKLGLPHSPSGALLRRHPWDRIIFNFPHTGGLTKDVNRQVRANQELLVKFFERAKELLAADGMIVVTVFEGEPYTLWNVRDLARHAALIVGRSFQFEAKAYDEYKHARTLGNLESGGGWKGEERGARTFCLEVPRDGGKASTGGKSKRQEEEEDDDDD